MADLRKMTAIVTGASSGIGVELAKCLSRCGARVALAARREALLAKVARECPGEVLIIPADVTRAEDRSEIVERTLGKWNRIDILINNAGLGGYGPFLNTSEAYWRELFEVNVFGPIFLTQAVLPAMLARDKGLIINICSIAGLLAHADHVCPYVASKHALVGFSRGLAKDLHGTGVRVLVPCPHLTDTAFFASGPGSEEAVAAVEGYRSFMDSPSAVAEGILEQLDSPSLILFPTQKPAIAFQRGRDI